MKSLDCIKFNPVADEATQWVSPVFVKKSKKGLHFIQLLIYVQIQLLQTKLIQPSFNFFTFTSNQ